MHNIIAVSTVIVVLFLWKICYICWDCVHIILYMSDITSVFLIIIMFVIDSTIDILYVVYKLITNIYDISISGAAFCTVINSTTPLCQIPYA